MAHGNNEDMRWKKRLWLVALACADSATTVNRPATYGAGKADRTKTRASTVGRKNNRDTEFITATKATSASTLSVDTMPGRENETSNCTERHHVIYVRIPKTGSSTMTFIMWMFGLRRGLTFLLPRPGFEGNQNQLTMDTFYLPNRNKSCDLMANHVIYDSASFKHYFSNDVQYITLLREPMSQLYSTIYYLRELKEKIPGKNKVTNYLRDPLPFEPKSDRSFTHNPMMSYLGLAAKDFNNTAKIRAKIKEIDNRFATVLILEKLDQSLLVLKRKLCWPMKDILYVIKNRNRVKPVVDIRPTDYALLKKWSCADYMLYDHFYAELEKAIKIGGESFQEELSIFRSIQNQTTIFCKTSKSKQPLTINGNKFSPPFQVTVADCHSMRTAGLRMLADLRLQQKRRNFCG